MSNDKHRNPGEITNTTGMSSDKVAAITNEVKNLFKMGKLSDHSVYSELQSKYGDGPFITAVLSEYQKRKEKIENKAKKFVDVLKFKYGSRRLPYSELIRKAKKYQTKYDLSNEEYSMFLNLASSDETYGSQLMYQFPNSEMGRTLGFSPVVATGDKLRIKDSQLNVLQGILDVCNDENIRTLYNHIVLQSLTYRDCSLEAISGTFTPNKHTAFIHVHPVLAAMFIPKVNYLDEHMIIANLANLVKTKYEGNPILTAPEYELYWDLITDPNEIACSGTNTQSPIVSLFNRTQVQIKLWHNIHLLRQGYYFTTGSQDLFKQLDKCPDNIYNVPDMAYVRDEGTILRKLLGAFSLRPTIVSTTPLFGAGFNNHYMPLSLSQVTSIPMITLRIPFQATNKMNIKVHLKESFEQPQWYYEKQLVVAKTQTILHSRDVIFFYVHRRYHHLGLSRLSNPPFSYTQLPLTVSSFERVNETLVDFTFDFTLPHDPKPFYLKSIVCVETSQATPDLIVGSSAAIRMLKGSYPQAINDGYLLYDPLSVGMRQLDGNQVKIPPPISHINEVSNETVNGPVESFFNRGRKRGTIFMYVREGCDQTKLFKN